MSLLSRPRHRRLHTRTTGRLSGSTPLWVHSDTGALCDPFVAQKAMALIEKSYRAIGGSATFRDPRDLCDPEYDQVDLLLDGDDVRVVKISKTTPFGVKSVAAANDGSDYARTEAKKLLVAWLGVPNHYGEVSGAVAAVALKAGVPIVDDQELVERVLRKKIEWHGPHPEGLFPGTSGWYTRTIGGTPHTKIMVGLPRLRSLPGRAAGR
jgi:hypothetical protein